MASSLSRLPAVLRRSLAVRQTRQRHVFQTDADGLVDHDIVVLAALALIADAAVNSLAQLPHICPIKSTRRALHQIAGFGLRLRLPFHHQRCGALDGDVVQLAYVGLAGADGGDERAWL